MLDSVALADLAADLSDNSYALAPESPEPLSDAELEELESSLADLASPLCQASAPTAVLPPSLLLDLSFDVPFTNCCALEF